jgi:hypothetical protein
MKAVDSLIECELPDICGHDEKPGRPRTRTQLSWSHIGLRGGHRHPAEFNDACTDDDNGRQPGSPCLGGGPVFIGGHFGGHGYPGHLFSRDEKDEGDRQLDAPIRHRDDRRGVVDVRRLCADDGKPRSFERWNARGGGADDPERGHDVSLQPDAYAGWSRFLFPAVPEQDLSLENLISSVKLGSLDYVVYCKNMRPNGPKFAPDSAVFRPRRTYL